MTTPTIKTSRDILQPVKFFSVQNFYKLYCEDPKNVSCSHLYNQLRVEIEKRFSEQERKELYRNQVDEYVTEVTGYIGITTELKQSMIDMARKNTNPVPIARAKDRLVKMLFAQLKQNNEPLENYINK